MAAMVNQMAAWVFDVKRFAWLTATVAMASKYLTEEPTRRQIDGFRGAPLLEFGAPWCGLSRVTQLKVNAALASYPELPHIKVADGPGRPLGRSFGIKLWPTLIALRDGMEVGRIVCPKS